MTDTQFVDYYELLAITPASEVAEIRTAFIAMAKTIHPDVGGSNEQMQLVTKAYKTLSNPSAKASYDMLHSFHTGTTKPSDYKYHDGRKVDDVSDMTDSEIDDFLDTVWAEYKQQPAAPQRTLKQKVKKFFEI